MVSRHLAIPVRLSISLIRELKLAIWRKVQCMKGLGLDVQSVGGRGISLKDNAHCIYSVCPRLEH